MMCPVATTKTKVIDDRDTIKLARETLKLLLALVWSFLRNLSAEKTRTVWLLGDTEEDGTRRLLE
jgi:hypothetical protein